MADITKTLEIIFNGIDKGVSSTIDGITGKFDGFGKALQSIESMAEPFSKLADYAIKADLALAAMAAGGIAASFEASKKFEAAVVDLDKVLENSEGLEKAKSFAKETAQAYGESTTNVLASVAAFKQAGFTIEESMTLAKAGLDLMIAGDISAAEASEKLVAILKGFNAPASDATRVIDTLNEVSNKYATNVKELADGMALVSPVAKTMGFSFEETAGLLTPIIEVFRSGTMSAEGLRTGLLKLVDDSKPVKDALGAMQISQTDVNGSMKSAKEILAEVATKFTGLTNEQKLFYTSQIVGMDQAPKMLIVFDQYQKALQVTKDALNSAGSAQSEVDKRLATSKIAVKQLGTAFENLGITVGEKFRSQATEGITGMTEFLKAIDKVVASGAFDPLLEQLKSMGTDIGDFFRELAKSFPEAMKQVDFTPLTDALKNLGDSVAKFFDGFDASDPESVADAIQTVVDALAFLINTTKGMADTFAPVIQSIIDSIKSLSESSVQDQELFGNILGAGKLVVSLGTEVVAALAAMQEWGVSAKDVFEVLGGSVKVVFNSLQALFDAFVMSFLDGLITLNKGAELVTFGDLNEQVKGATRELESWRNAVAQDYDSQIKDIDDGLRMMGEGFGIAGESAANAGNSMADFRQKADAATKDPIEPKMEFDPANYQGALDLIKSFGDSAVIKPTVDEAATRAAGGFLKELIGIDENGLPIYLYTDIKTSSIDKAKAKIEEIPKDKEMEIKLKGETDKELAKIKANAETLQTAMEWKAKLDIANVEAGAKIVASMFDSVSVGIKSADDSITKLLSSDWDKMGLSQMMQTQDFIRKQIEFKEKEYKLQEKLINQQIEIMKTKNDMMKSGKGLIKIDSTGLEPALETILWQILQKVQLKANEDAANFLLGIK